MRAPYEAYLDLELRSDTKHDYLDGEIVPSAMSGGTIEHAAIAAAFARLIGNALEGRPCRTYSSDLRVRVEATNGVFYPDVTVVCGAVERSLEDDHAVVNAVLVVEVLSPSTEGYDRGAKAAHYRHLPSLKEYVFVSQDRRHVEVYRKNAESRWELWEYEAGQRIGLASIDVELDLDRLYADPLAAEP